MAVVLFALWSNFHAGFLFGLTLIGFYLIGDLLDRAAALRRHAWIFGAALAGTCINPSGPDVIIHVASYFRKTWLVDITNEMRSPDFHGAVGRTFLVLLMLCLLILARSGRRPPWQHLIVFLGTTAFALESKRHVALWALTGFPLILLHASPWWASIRWKPFSRVRDGIACGGDLAHAGLWSLIPVALLAVASSRGGMIGDTRVLPNRFDPSAFPVRIVERARAAGIQGRMFNDFVWGGYILYAWPEQKVFIDGQSDFYGVPLNQLYMSIRKAEPGWEQRLDSLGVDMVLMPSDTPLAGALEDSTTWMMADSADGAVRFARR